MKKKSVTFNIILYVIFAKSCNNAKDENCEVPEKKDYNSQSEQCKLVNRNKVIFEKISRNKK